MNNLKMLMDIEKIIEQLREDIKLLQRATSKNDSRLSLLEKTSDAMQDDLIEIKSEVKDTHRIVTSMTTNLGYDRDSGMPNTLCGLFARLYESIDVILERDQAQQAQISKLTDTVTNLTASVNSKSWVRSIIEKTTVQTATASLALISGLILAFAQPWANKMPEILNEIPKVTAE